MKIKVVLIGSPLKARGDDMLGETPCRASVLSKLIEKILLIDEDNLQQEVKLSYENLSNEEIFKAVNYSTYTASILLVFTLLYHTYNRHIT